MKLYVWNNPYPVDYGGSCLYVIANNLQEARKLAETKVTDGSYGGHDRKDMRPTTVDVAGDIEVNGENRKVSWRTKMGEGLKRAFAAARATRKNQRPIWSYGPYRAMLYKNGKPFAMVTPNGRDALLPKEALELTYWLNGGKHINPASISPPVSTPSRQPPLNPEPI